MRVTTKMMSNTYLKNVNNLTSGTQNSLNQLSSGMKIFRASENTAAAVKAYQVRTSLLRNEGYMSNLSHANAILSSSESVLMGIQESMLEAKGKIVQAMNGTTNAANRQTIAGEIRSIQSQLMESMNANDSGFYIFGGSNTDNKPFAVGDTGELTYNGYPLSSLTDPDILKTLGDDSLYLDIGLEPEFDEAGNIIKSTVFEYSIPGINVIGHGTSELYDSEGNLMTDADGNPVMASNNLYDLLGQIAAELEKPDGEYNPVRADALYGRFENVSESITTQLTNIGAKTSYIEYTENRLETLDFNLTSKQSDIEDVDYAESYITYTSLFTSYQAALKIGSQIIGPSLFDYLR